MMTVFACVAFFESLNIFKLLLTKLTNFERQIEMLLSSHLVVNFSWTDNEDDQRELSKPGRRV